MTATEEAALVTVLSDQKRIGNSSESSLKGTVWRMVQASIRVIGEGPSKVQKQCQGVIPAGKCPLSILGFCSSPLLAQGRVTSSSGKLRINQGLVECRFAAGNGARSSMGQFSQGSVLLFIVRSLLTSNTCQSHPGKLPFQEKGFPLFDELAYLWR